MNTQKIVIRGCSWYYCVRNISHIDWGASINNKSNNFGFRVVLKQIKL